MFDRLIELVLDESKWMAFAMVSAAGLVTVTAWLERQRERPGRAHVLAAMNRFYGCVIGVMGTGHLLAVSIQLGRGTLDGNPADGRIRQTLTQEIAYFQIVEQVIRVAFLVRVPHRGVLFDNA